MTTQENIGSVRESMAAIDQRDEIAVGCETWAIKYDGGQRGQMTRWHDGTGAVAWGGNSFFGVWSGDELRLHGGATVDVLGHIVDDQAKTREG